MVKRLLVLDTPWAQIMVLYLLCDSREQFNLSKPIFPPLENWDNNSTFLKGLLYRLNWGRGHAHLIKQRKELGKCQANVHV